MNTFPPASRQLRKNTTIKTILYKYFKPEMEETLLVKFVFQNIFVQLDVWYICEYCKFLHP